MNSITHLVSNIVPLNEGGNPCSSERPDVPERFEPQSKDELLQHIQTLEAELHSVREKSKFIAQELDLFRQRRAIFWSDRFRNTFDAWSLLSKGFQRLKDDTAIFASDLKGYRLQPSLSMLRVSYLSYKVKLNTKGLTGVYLAPVVEFPLQKGEIVLQIMEESKRLLVETSVPVAQISDDGPVAFRFPPLQNSDNELIFNIFVQNVDVPVRLLEMRRYALGGFGRLSTVCFAGFIFDGE
jgi:hypothetical protein